MENQEYTKRNNELLAELEKYPENSKEYRDIVAKIVKTNEPLVTYVAKKFFPFAGSEFTSDDLISEGYVALLNAVRTFDLEKEIAFSTYAVHCIKHKISRFLKQELKTKKVSLEATVNESKYGDKRKLKDDLVSPVNIEKDFAEKDETDRQMDWVRKNLDHLKPIQKQVLISKYLSGEASLSGDALAEKLNCTRQNISSVENRAINKLKKIYAESHPEKIKMKAEIELMNEEKIKLKEVLKNLIETKLPPMRKKTMLCKFYSPAQKTNEQVAEEIGSTQQNVEAYVSASYKKLCTLCDSIKDTKHLKNILEFRVAESGKEC